jgi:DNA polymerase-1
MATDTTDNGKIDKDKERILLIDSNALVHRAYHAYPPTLRTSEGQLTNAVFGFSFLLLNIINKFKPKYIVCVFDSKKPTFRHEQFPDYKATRKPMDEELVEQLPIIKEVVDAFSIPRFIRDGYEADDLIGTFVHDEDLKALEKIVVTGDQDILQLVDDDEDISVYLSGRTFSQAKTYHEEQVRKKYHFEPLQIIDYKALMGDASDNIPGVKGIGKKSAQALLQKFDSVEQVYKSIEKAEAGDDQEIKTWEVKPFKRMYKKLLKGREMAFQSKDLATIYTDIPIEFDLKDATVSDYSRSEVKELFKKLEFKSLFDRVPDSSRVETDRVRTDQMASDKIETAQKANSSEKPQNSDQANLFTDFDAKNKDDNNGKDAKEGDTEMMKQKDVQNFTWYQKQDYEVITSPNEANKRIEGLTQQPQIAFDTEADSLDHMNANLLGLSFSMKAGSAFYLSKGVLGDEKVKKALKDFFENAKTLIAHNLKYDLHILKNYGISLEETSNHFDTLIASYLLSGGEGLQGNGLKDLAFNKFGMELTPYSELLSEEAKSTVAVKKEKGVFDPKDKEEEQILGKYCCGDSDATFRLFELFSKELAKDSSLKDLFKEIEMPLVIMLLEMERAGVYLDISELEDLKKQAQDSLSAIEDKIYEISGHDFNIASPKQVGEVLFDELKIQEDAKIQVSKTKTGAYSTDERTLKNFSANHEIVELILKHRNLSKLISTYIEGLASQVAQSDKTSVQGTQEENKGKVFTNYNQAVASTGRLSSSDPNLQNIPVSDEFGRKIRKAFKPGKGRVFLAFDYAQQELRLLAHLSEEEKLIEAFKNNVDIHKLTASQILNIPLDEVKKDDRRVGKTVNFGVVYGISPFGLADRLKIDRAQAKNFIDKFFTKYSKVSKYFEGLVDQAKDRGEIYTILGRRRDARGLASSNFRVRRAVEREIINFPLQGGAADIMKLAMIKVREAIRSNQVPCSEDLITHLQVHDELIFSLSEENYDKQGREVVKKIKDIMFDVYSLSVPLTVDAEVGKDWYSLKKVD